MQKNLMRINIKRIWIACLWLTCACWTIPGEAAERKIIIIPPHVDYISPLDDVNAPHAMLHAGLGRSLYFNMRTGIIEFNSLEQARKAPLRYTALPTVTVGQQDNRIIQEFYQAVADDPARLKNACRRFQSDVIAWSNFEPDYEEKLVDAMEQNADCAIRIRMRMFVCDGNRYLPDKTLESKFNINSGTFSEVSRRALSVALVQALKNLHFPETNESEPAADDE